MSRDPARHELGVWPATLWCAASKAQLRKVSKALDLPGGLEAEHAGRTWSVTGSGGLQIVVYVDVKGSPSRLDLIDTCAHEASHAADGVFEYVEEDRPGAESRAYLVGWLTRQLLTHCDPSTEEKPA